MNKVIIVGHPCSAYEEIEELLRICGLAYANNSIREGFTPQQITQTLCKAYGVALSRYYENIEQINVGAVWHSIVLDLMLANIDQQFWGWSDPNAVYLLDFWKSVDPAIAFILVYDKPESVFTHHDSYLSETDYAKESLKSWSAYNAELLNFYRNNQDRSLLVHAQQIHLSAASYIQQLKGRISKSLKFPDKVLWKGTEISFQASKKTAKNRKANVSAFAPDQQITENIITSSSAVSSHANNPLSQYIAKDLVRSNRHAQRIYKELQESANLPLINEGVGGIAAVDAWQAMMEQLHKSKIQDEQIQNAQEMIDNLKSEISKTKAEHEDTKKIVADKERKTKELEAKNQELQAKSQEVSKENELGRENELLLSQLHQVQEELERYYLENQELKKNTKPQSLSQQEIVKPKLYGAKERVKNTLEYRIGGLMIAYWKQKGKLTLLPALKKTLKEWQDIPHVELPPLEDYIDAEEGYRTQKHLSYRLGITWLNHKNLLTLPKAILKDVKEFREYKTNKIKVSVIIPVYNVEPYLRQCLDSVINQTLKEIEIICVDDGSTDNSLSILNEYAKKDGRFTVLKQKNSGAGAARNKGLAIAKGEYLSFLDSDDFFEPTMLEEMYRKTNQTNTDIVICDGFLYDNATQQSKRGHFLKYDLVKKFTTFSRNDIPNDILFVSVPYLSVKLYKKPFVKQTGIKFQNLPSCNDIYFSFMTMALAQNISYINKLFVTYRTNIKTNITSKRGDKYDNMFISYLQVRKTLDKNIFNLIEQSFNKRLLNSCIYEYSFIPVTMRNDFLAKCRRILPDDVFNSFEKSILPKISIIIPVYNVESYLKQCLDSATNQTLKEIEIICVNDGSTDTSLAILQQYAQKDARIKIINQKNGGLANARNSGIKAANGEYIGFVDSDDWIDLDYYDKLYKAAKEQNADLARTSYIYVYGDNDRKEDNFGKTIERKAKNNEPLNVNEHTIIVCNAIYRRKYLLENNIAYFDDTHRYHEDIFFTARATNLSKKSIAVHGVYYYYRKNIDQRLSTMNNNNAKLIVNSVAYNNKITCDFINSAKYDNTDDYVVAYKRCLWRYDDLFGRALHFANFTETEQYHLFDRFLYAFNECRYKEKLLREPYYEILKKSDFNLYRGYKQENIAAKNDAELIVSLTSYPARIKTVHKTIETLLSQSHKADKVILWLTYEEFPNKEKDLPKELINLTKSGLSIFWCENLKPYNKLIPTLKEYPNSII
ncbi:MAG: glycosyltransferase, partial [Campylobacteraceae bacterium]|nr:glycosyltransferase [Campylobacteraceae bacterium]